MTTDGELFVSSLKSMLDKQYEHFGQINDHILGMWAGPEHWRKKAKRRKVDVITGLEGDADLDEISPLSHNQNCGKTGRKPRRGKKSLAAVLDYKTAMEPSENRTRNGHLARKTWCKSELSEGLPNSSAPNATVFKDAYRQKATGQLNLLPSEWTDTRNTLYQLCNREVILKTNNLSGSRIGAPPNEQDTLGPHPQTTASAGYDFDWIHRHPEDDQLVIGGNSEQLSEPPDSPIGIGDDDDDDDLDHLPPYAGVFTQDINTQVDNAVMDGIDLVAQPRKIARIEIGYARTAKMINVHRLKAVMWDFLEASFSPTSPNPAQSPPTSTGESSSQPQKTVTFSSLVATLPDRLSWQMVKELSVPIALNCLLHLANEKDMFFMCTENLTDVLISRGLPDSELEALESYRLSSESNETDLPPSKASRTEGNRSKKHKRPRSSTLDSWLADSDPSVQTPC
ncbi:unnamed protein product [Dicrocoelium dendriticum]|nr:unnamed protein product [Dicrocoelium dendriticum]